jgi:nucleoid-associated protein YgaU
MPAPSVLGGLDPGMPAEMQKAVVGALTTETDPAKLQGFASAIQAQYPVAAGLLMAKAQALLLVHPITPPAPQPTPPRPLPPPSPSPVPIPTDGTYTVLPGDFPIKIAQKLVHDGSRWKELVAANPNKKRAADGNFATLLPGEVLKLPASWTAAPPLIDMKPHALPSPGGTHAAHS